MSHIYTLLESGWNSNDLCIGSRPNSNSVPPRRTCLSCIPHFFHYVKDATDISQLQIYPDCTTLLREINSKHNYSQNLSPHFHAVHNSQPIPPMLHFKLDCGVHIQIKNLQCIVGMKPKIVSLLAAITNIQGKPSENNN